MPLPTSKKPHIAFPSPASQAEGGEDQHISQSGRWVWDTAGFPLSFPVNKNVLREEDAQGASLVQCWVSVV